ncbi:MAG: dihydrolipoamide acetyltransferase component of pyruvate dehydrogenase complex [Armatimonadota bacterium]|nr:MAG: dihydrolipoamide acetyltransferase component of pyruvate dehydrogenase complex [Armatimonadota bacterium]
MATKVTLPLLGQTMEEGTIIKWFKKEGDRVEKEEPLLEVMTDKANMEVESPESGVLLKIVAQEDETVPVKGLIAILGEPGEDISALLAEAGAVGEAAAAPAAPAEAPAEEKTVSEPSAPSAAASAPAAGRVSASPRARRLAEEHGIDLAQLAPGSGPGGRIIEKDVLRAIESGVAAAPAAPAATPLAAKVAEEKGVDLAAVSGSGPGGKIRREDVEAAAAPAAVPLAPRVPLGGVIPFAGLRKAVADNLEKSARSVIPVTLTMGVDMTEATRMREQLKPVYEKKHGVKLSFTDIVIKAVARAIEDYPIINSSLEGDQIRIHDGVHVCVAVAVPDGLLAPVVRDANLKPLWAISAEVRDLAERGRSGRLGPSELSGGTFTVTNLGAYGVEHFNAIINPPQCAILAVCAIHKQPVVVEGDRIEVRPMMNLCLTFDHRIVDGAPAAEFLAHVKSLLENPYLFLG